MAAVTNSGMKVSCKPVQLACARKPDAKRLRELMKTDVRTQFLGHDDEATKRPKMCSDDDEQSQSCTTSLADAQPSELSWTQSGAQSPPEIQSPLISLGSFFKNDTETNMEVKTLEAGCDFLQCEVDYLRNKISDQEEQISDQEEQIIDLEVSNTQLRDEVSAKTEEINDLSEEITDLKANIEALQKNQKSSGRPKKIECRNHLVCQGFAWRKKELCRKCQNAEKRREEEVKAQCKNFETCRKNRDCQSRLCADCRATRDKKPNAVDSLMKAYANMSDDESSSGSSKV